MFDDGAGTYVQITEQEWGPGLKQELWFAFVPLQAVGITVTRLSGSGPWTVAVVQYDVIPAGAVALPSLVRLATATTSTLVASSPFSSPCAGGVSVLVGATLNGTIAALGSFAVRETSTAVDIRVGDLVPQGSSFTVGMTLGNIPPDQTLSWIMMMASFNSTTCVPQATTTPPTTAAPTVAPTAPPVNVGGNTTISSSTVPSLVVSSAGNLVVSAGTVVTVTGNSTIDGALILEPGATLIVNGLLTINGALTGPGDQVQVGGTLVLGPGATFRPVVTVAPSSTTTVTVVIATFGSAQGSLCATAQLTFANAQCVSASTPTTAQQSANALSVTVSLQQVCNNGGLSPGALAGIVVGSILFAAAVAAAVGGFLWHRHKSQKTLEKLRATM